MHYDLTVVGAGPTYAAVAYLARNKHSVLLLEKSLHPRHKPCGSGVTARILPYLEDDFCRAIKKKRQGFRSDLRRSASPFIRQAARLSCKTPEA